MKKNPVVIAVSAVSGGGKTTTINELSKRLSSSRVIYFDDYEFEMCSSCSDFNAWNIEELIDDIKELVFNKYAAIYCNLKLVYQKICIKVILF